MGKIKLTGNNQLTNLQANLKQRAKKTRKYDILRVAYSNVLQLKSHFHVYY